MAGYSGTPLWKKLGMKEGSRWAVIAAPRGFVIDDRPDREPKLTKVQGVLDGALIFCQTQRELDTRITQAIACLIADGGIWIAWPKKSSRLAGELEFMAVQHAGLSRGLVDNKVCAVDDDWSGLRFVVRREDRATWPVKLRA